MIETIEARTNKMLPIVADSWESLRGCDVYRLIRQFCAVEHEAVGKIITAKRQDLAGYVSNAIEDLGHES